MDEAAIQLQMAVDMPERVVPVVVIEMSIATEHLLDNRFAVLLVILWKARCFTDPVFMAPRQSSH